MSRPRFGAAPPEAEEVGLPSLADDVAGMSWRQLQLLAASLVTVNAAEDSAAIATPGTDHA
jgi:hypothetical protein